MTYKINGVELDLQPTMGRWVPRKSLGMDGAGHPVYPSTRQFEMRWDLVYPSDFNTLQGYFNTVITTGTAVVDLPEYGASSYSFKSYSGCTLSEPDAGNYYTQHQTKVRLLVANITT